MTPDQDFEAAVQRISEMEHIIRSLNMRIQAAHLVFEAEALIGNESGQEFQRGTIHNLTDMMLDMRSGMHIIANKHNLSIDRKDVEDGDD